MVIVFKPGAPEENKAKMRSNLESKGFQINEINGVNMTIFGIIGDTSTLDINMLRIDDAVDKVMRVQEPFKRANRRNAGAGYGHCQVHQAWRRLNASRRRL